MRKHQCNHMMQFYILQANDDGKYLYSCFLYKYNKSNYEMRDTH